MGWSYECQPSRLKDFLKERASGWGGVDTTTGGKTETKCLTSKYVMFNPGAGTLWKVMETTGYTKWGAVIKGPERWIAMDMIRWGGGKRAGWGYKDMEESSGPNDISCPLKYLEMVPDPLPCTKPDCSCPKDWARYWRERVRAKHAIDQKRKLFLKGLKPGDIIVIADGYTIASGKQVTVERVKPLVAGNFNLKPRHIDVEASLAAVGIDKEAV